MKCPKCGYNSFESLDSCKKCSADLSEHKTRFGLRGFLAPGQQTPAAVAAVEDELAAGAGKPVADFGFDFLDEETPPTTDAAATGASSGAADADEGFSLEDDSFSLDQPFGVDAENIPAEQQKKA
ncbi:MAG: hypothetical protein RQ723_03375 [Desulfuromonadales bacterium]|nr:hypothetical protein [Desulfuromonadales bacterium]